MLKRSINQIPNLLTSIRIISAFPILVIFSLISYYQRLDNTLYQKQLILVLLVLFTLGVITDLFDGYLARKLNLISEFGRIIDPIADKILINITLFGLSLIYILPFWTSSLFLIRDIFVDGLRLFGVKKGKDLSANKLGKLKTFLQVIGIVNGLIISSIFGLEQTLIINLFANFLLYIALTFSLISGINYLFIYTK